MLDVRCSPLGRGQGWVAQRSGFKIQGSMFDVRCSMLLVPFPSREGPGVGYSAPTLQRPALTHPADSALPVTAFASHACKSAWCSRPCVRVIPGQFGYRNRIAKAESQTNVAENGN